MSRMLKAYELRFRALLQRVGARRLDQGVRWLVGKANRLALNEDVSQPNALARVEAELVARPRFCVGPRPPAPEPFHCDAGLGGLARWLRAAGYEARWIDRIADDRLLQIARENGGTVLTTDSLLMERRVVRDGVIPALWLPPTLTVDRQLAIVFREYGLKPGEPRCMTCGGELDRVEKEALRERIPPRTYRWLDEYFVCRRCGKLFWRGTHWERISSQLRRLT
jgi:uncharacterized protein